jgi:protein O-GlcNAc transferase
MNDDLRKTLHEALGLINTGRATQAADLVERAWTLAPNDSSVQLVRGSWLVRMNRASEAVPFLTAAKDALPADPQRWLILARAQQLASDNVSALATIRQAVLAHPKNPEMYKAWATIAFESDEAVEALDAQLQLLTIDPNQRAMGALLAPIYSALAQHRKADDIFKDALAIMPTDPVVAASRAALSNSWGHLSAKDCFDYHAEITRRFSKIPALNLKPLANTKDPNRRLKVGIMSADFRQHSITYFLHPLLNDRPRDQVHITLYANARKGDSKTPHILALADHAVITTGMNELQAATKIQQDAIDVLIDLSGLTQGTGVYLMRSRVAPIHINYLGYPNTTGIPGVDYRLVDWITDPAGTESLATEKLHRLDRCFLAYTPEPGLPSPPPPRTRQATSANIVFASFNTLHKVGEQTLNAWAAVLAKVPNSLLLLKGHGYEQLATQRYFIEQFANRAITQDRLRFLGRDPSATDHLLRYQDVDIALDTFPYNGTTTTCEALWMGVPVLTIAGDRHAARVGASLLTTIGAPELIAQDVNDLANRAAKLASDPLALDHYRATLQAKALASALANTKDLSRAIFSSIRKLWQDWCTSS